MSYTPLARGKRRRQGPPTPALPQSMRAAAALEMRKAKALCWASTLLRPLHPQKAARVEANAINTLANYQDPAAAHSTR